MNPAAPFAPDSGRDGFFESDGLREALQRLSDARGEREPFVVVTGEPGSGKTTLVREAIARWGATACAAWLSCPAHSDAELVEEVVRRFGAEAPDGASVPRLVACFEHALSEIAARGQLAIIVVDDAHALEPGMLEELRLLVNAAQRAGRRIEVMLVGLPALHERLEEPSLAALRQRVSVRCVLEAFSPADTIRYLHHRVSASGGNGPGLFGRKSCREIATQSRGVPREINALASESLRRARAAGQSTVGTDHVRAATMQLWGRVLPPAGLDTSPEDVAAVEAAAAPDRTAVPDRVSDPTASRKNGTAAPSAKQPAETSRPAAAPAASPATATPAPSASSAPSAFDADPANRAPVPPQDPREWVQRFVGDRGPIRIGSQAAGPSSWSTEDADARAVRPTPSASRPAPTPRPEPVDRAEPSAPPASAPGAESPRSWDRNAMLVPALIVVAVVSLVVILVRAGDGQRSRHAVAGQVATQRDSATTSIPLQDRPAARLARSAEASHPAAEQEALSQATEDAVPDTIPMTRSSRLTLDVGSYISSDRAASERDRLRAKTGLGAWVVREAEGGNESFHVLLGIYRTNARASAAADMLLIEGRVSQVKVVRLPPRRSRR